MTHAPLIILGLDTGDVDLIRRWAAEGHLPTLASIMERGAWGRTAGPELICEYGLSLTLFSGVSRADHGYYYFRQLEPGTYDLTTVVAREVGTLPFWSHLDPGRQRVLTLDVPDLAPVRGVPGMQVADWGTHHGSSNEPLTEPPELLADVERIFGPRLVVHGASGHGLVEEQAAYRKLLERVERKGTLAVELLQRGEVDMAALFFADSDAASHFFWDHRPEADPGGAHPLRHALRDVYAAIDRQFARILAVAPHDATVVVLSLYGSQDQFPTSTLIETFLQELGYHAPATGGAARGPSLSPVALARRLVPEPIRRAISRHLPATAQESLLAGRLRDSTDWSRTTAFAIPSLYTSFVRVNLRGREPQGIVEPGADYEALLGRIEADLRALVDPVTGGPAIQSVARTSELFGRGVPADLPDLFVEWVPTAHFMSRVEHPRGTFTQPRPHHFESSQERLEGLVAVAGPSIAARGEIGEVDLLDLAPTFLALMGTPPPPEMGGQPRTDLLADAVVRAASPR